MNPNPNKETPEAKASNAVEQEIEEILAKVGEHIERHFGHEALIKSGMMLLGVRNEILELLATHYKAEAEARYQSIKEQAEREARLDEVSLTLKAWHGTDDKEFADIMNDRLDTLHSTNNKPEER